MGADDRLLNTRDRSALIVVTLGNVDTESWWVKVYMENQGSWLLLIIRLYTLVDPKLH